SPHAAALVGSSGPGAVLAHVPTDRTVHGGSSHRSTPLKDGQLAHEPTPSRAKIRSGRALPQSPRRALACPLGTHRESGSPTIGAPTYTEPASQDAKGESVPKARRRNTIARGSTQATAAPFAALTTPVALRPYHGGATSPCASPRARPDLRDDRQAPSIARTNALELHT